MRNDNTHHHTTSHWNKTKLADVRRLVEVKGLRYTVSRQTEEWNGKFIWCERLVQTICQSLSWEKTTFLSFLILNLLEYSNFSILYSCTFLLMNSRKFGPEMLFGRIHCHCIILILESVSIIGTETLKPSNWSYPKQLPVKRYTHSPHADLTENSPNIREALNLNFPQHACKVHLLWLRLHVSPCLLPPFWRSVSATFMFAWWLYLAWSQY